MTGSSGGATIIQFVVKTLVSALDWNLDAQQATSMVNFGAANSPTTGVGGEHPAIDVSNNGLNDPLLVGLRDLGHTVSFAAQSSGVSTVIRRQKEGYPGQGTGGRRRSAARGHRPGRYAAAALRPRAQVPPTKGLLRRSWPKVLSGPWPGMNTVSSPIGHSRWVMLAISVA